LHLITLNDTHTHGITSLDEGSARRGDLYLKINNMHKRETAMPPAEFEPAITASERRQIYALGHAATGIGFGDYN
jgi:hypothetical protein